MVIRDNRKTIKIGFDGKLGLKGNETAIRKMLCGENIIDGQVVKRIGGLIFVAKNTDNDLEFIQGVAIQSGSAGEYIDVLLYGLGRVPQSLNNGYLYLDANGFLSNHQTNHYVLIGYKVGEEILVFQNKEVIYVNI